MTPTDLDDTEERWRSYTRLGPWWADMRRLIQEVRRLHQRVADLQRDLEAPRQTLYEG